jgi:hypothetical protein
MSLPKLIYKQHTFRGYNIERHVEHVKIIEVNDPLICLSGITRTPIHKEQ